MSSLAQKFSPTTTPRSEVTMSDPSNPEMPDLSSLLGGGGGEGGGMPDLGGLMAQAQEMMAKSQEAAAEVVEGSAGGGVVRIEVDGGFQPQSVHIDASVVDPNEIEMLQDLVLAALRDAATQIADSQSDALGGMDLGGLGGLLGGQ